MGKGWKNYYQRYAYDFSLEYSESFRSSMEKALVVALDLGNDAEFLYDLEELKRLCEACEMEVVDTVIQTCAGIEPTDFELLFMKIREQLYKEEKNLTVFIEDITSATGVKWSGNCCF